MRSRWLTRRAWLTKACAWCHAFTAALRAQRPMAPTHWHAAERCLMRSFGHTPARQLLAAFGQARAPVLVPVCFLMQSCTRPVCPLWSCCRVYRVLLGAVGGAARGGGALQARRVRAGVLQLLQLPAVAAAAGGVAAAAGGASAGASLLPPLLLLLQFLASPGADRCYRPIPFARWRITLGQKLLGAQAAGRLRPWPSVCPCPCARVARRDCPG